LIKMTLSAACETSTYMPSASFSPPLHTHQHTPTTALKCHPAPAPSKRAQLLFLRIAHSLARTQCGHRHPAHVLGARVGDPEPRASESSGTQRRCLQRIELTGHGPSSSSFSCDINRERERERRWHTTINHVTVNRQVHPALPLSCGGMRVHLPLPFDYDVTRPYNYAPLTSCKRASPISRGSFGTWHR
jgi:hypothetical protein